MAVMYACKGYNGRILRHLLYQDRACSINKLTIIKERLDFVQTFYERSWCFDLQMQQEIHRAIVAHNLER